MQFLPFPITNLVRPISYTSSVSQLMCLALSLDFKKYSFCVKVNELVSVESEMKKLQNTDTTISSSSEEEIQMSVKGSQKKQKAEVNQKNKGEFENIGKQNDQIKTNQPKKREYFEKARNQIIHAFKSFNQQYENDAVQNQEKENEKKYQQQISVYQSLQNIKRVKFAKQKKIFKGKKCIRFHQKEINQVNCHISTNVSLIETIDLPRVYISRLELIKKKQSLLSRMFEYNDNQNRKTIHQTRQRRQLKKLN